MQKIIPFSKNILFFDAEFTSLEFEKSELLSFGAVTLDGASFYCEVEQDLSQASEFVQEHVAPLLTGTKISTQEAQKQIRAFVTENFGDTQPYLTTYVYKYDAYHWYKLFGYDDDLTHRIILDFASMLFAHGIDPEKNSAAQRDKFLSELGIDVDAFEKHNALSDAQILREAYLAISQKND